MIDTIGVRFEASPTVSQLKNWYCTMDINPNGSNQERYRLYLGENPDARLLLIFDPPNRTYRKASLRLSCSLPKILYGTNVEMITTNKEIRSAIGRISIELGSSALVPSVDVSRGELHRLDFCYNHQVGHHVDEYIQAFFHLEYPRRSTKPYHPTEGVQFYSRMTTTTFYDKHAESGRNEAAGILRQETSLRKGWNINRRLNGGNPVLLGDISVAMAQEVLQNDLQLLGIDTQVISSLPDAFDRLIKTHGITKAIKLIGFLAIRSVVSTDHLVRLGSIPRTNRRYENALREAGVSVPLLKHKVLLPPLTISLDNFDR